LNLKIPDDRSYLVELTDGILQISFNRPEFSNAIKAEMVLPLTQLFINANAEPDVRVILVRGEGKMFSAGGDVAGFATTLELDVSGRQQEFRTRISRLRDLAEAVVAFDRPILVGIRGAVAGAGLLYPLAADYVIGDTTTLFAFAHQSIGLSPDGGVSSLLPQVVGLRTARGLIVTAARVKADEALRLGLVNQLVNPEELEETVNKVANRLARAPQGAVKLAKKLVNESPERTLTEQLEAETAGIVSCVADGDFDEGVRAFIDKRPPKFPSAC